ncbi:MAG: glycosyltransferase family 9 protein [Proteobacteria bacterium]|nr:MAG: glycosyltransferase family 9 protein [Pseudomonadota bacterium]
MQVLTRAGRGSAVVRATSLLKSIKRKYPGSHITWVTDAPSDQLLRNHPQIDRVLTSKPEDLLTLAALEFDVAFAIDKSPKVSGILRQTKAELIFGFVTDPAGGAILPATAAATELWSLGLDNQKKFFINQKAETQLMVEAFELGTFQRDPYNLPLTVQEMSERERRHLLWKNTSDVVIGLNTGCSTVIPYKKLSVEFHRQLIRSLQSEFRAAIVLLGGPEDTERNQQIAYGMNVIQTATGAGLRDGLVSVAACDIVVTGDSLGMHMAISQAKYTIAWFGPTCAQEIDLYERGEKILSKAPCAPCWKRVCDKSLMCYDQVSLEEIAAAVRRGIQNCQPEMPMSLSKLPSSEICS